jgi:galactokinase
MPKTVPLMPQPTPATAPFTVLAPGRVNLIGEHTDYNDGFVLPMAIEREVTIRVRPRRDRLALLSTDRELGTTTLDLTQPFSPLTFGPGNWLAYPAGVLAGFQQLGWEIPGFEADVSATLPAGGGLSSSAALEVATATLVETLCGRSLEPLEKALLCQAAEHAFAGVPCGIMDQMAVCCARAGHALLIDCRSLELQHVFLPAELSVLVINSGVKHSLADGAYARRREECAAAAAGLGLASLRDLPAAGATAGLASLPLPERARARHVFYENDRVLRFTEALAKRDWPTAGRLMAESHWSLSRDYEVSCPELDQIVERAMVLPGVYGCRMTGGGFGGCAVALVDAARATEIGSLLHESYRQATGIAADWFLTRAAAGPRVMVSAS